MEKKVSIREIAERANVSIATVSRVINGSGKYSSETERRVWQVIRESRYFTNTAARSLRMNTNRSVGIFLPDMSNEHFAEITVNIQRQLCKNNYSTLICNLPAGDDYAKRYRNLLDINNVSGIISLFNYDLLLDYFPIGSPIVFVGIKPFIGDEAPDMPYACIHSDMREISRRATELLLSRGCRKIVYTYQDKSLVAGQYRSYSERYAGFADALKQWGCGEDNYIMLTLSNTRAESARDGLMRLLEIHPDIDGVFCNSAMDAVGSIHALKAKGKRVPEDARVVSFDDASMSRFYSPQITSVSIDAEEYANLTAQCMLDLIEGRPLKQRDFLLPAKLLIREST